VLFKNKNGYVGHAKCNCNKIMLEVVLYTDDLVNYKWF